MVILHIDRYGVCSVAESIRAATISRDLLEDLIHWNVGGPSTGFGGLTGSVAVTPAGAFAFYPEGSQMSYTKYVRLRTSF